MGPAVKAGISIGSIFCFVLIVLTCLLAQYLLSKHRRPQQGEDYRGNVENAKPGQSAHVQGDLADKQTPWNVVAEADGVVRYEADSQSKPIEIYGISRAELCGDTGEVARS